MVKSAKFLDHAPALKRKEKEVRIPGHVNNDSGGM
jgi:hypothetical protein